MVVQIDCNGIQIQLLVQSLSLFLIWNSLADIFQQFLIIKKRMLRGILKNTGILAVEGHGACQIVYQGCTVIAQLIQLVCNGIVDEFVGNIIETDKTFGMTIFVGKKADGALHHNRGQIFTMPFVFQRESGVVLSADVHEIPHVQLFSYHKLFFLGENHPQQLLIEKFIATAYTKIQGVGGMANVVQQLVLCQVKMAFGQNIGLDCTVKHPDFVIVLLLPQLFRRNIHAYPIGIGRGGNSCRQGIDKSGPMRRLSRLRDILNITAS